MSNEWYSEQPYDETATTDDQEQSLWDEVTEWVEDVTDTAPEPEPAPSSSGAITDLAEHMLYPMRRDAEANQLERENQLAAFRGSLRSAIQASELLGPESSSDEVRYAASLTSAAANAAYATADALGHNSTAGSRCAQYQGTLAWAASELESVAYSDSADVRQSSIPGIVSTLHSVGSDAESLY
jgi:hypothetical protein